MKHSSNGCFTFTSQPDQTVFCEIFSAYSLFQTQAEVILHIWLTYSMMWKILLSWHIQPACNQWRRSVTNLGGPGLRPTLSLFQSSIPSVFPSFSWTSQGSGQSPLTRCQTFWCGLHSQTALSILYDGH